MERNTIIIISIIEIFAICALIISILVYTQSIDTRGKNFTGKVVDNNGKQIKMNQPKFKKKLTTSKFVKTNRKTLF